MLLAEVIGATFDGWDEAEWWWRVRAMFESPADEARRITVEASFNTAALRLTRGPRCLAQNWMADTSKG